MERNIIQIIREYNIDPKNGKFQHKEMETKKAFSDAIANRSAFLSYICVYVFMIAQAVSSCSEWGLLLQSTGSRLSVE